MAFARISNTPTSKQALAGLLAGCLLAAIGCSPATPPDPPAEEAAGVEAAAPPPQPPQPPWRQHLDEVQPTVEAWARAWSDQDVDTYLAHYSPDFQTPNGMSRDAWQAQRRQRLTAPSEISVILEDLNTVGFKKAWLGGKQHELVSVRFRQSYQSDTFGDEVVKELQLEWLDPDWKIVTETSL